MQIRTAVLGARGRMGSASVREFSSLDDIEVAAEIDMGEPLDALTDKSVSVALDFTQPQAAVENVCWCIDHGVSIVVGTDRKSTRLNSSHVAISYAVFCLKKKKKIKRQTN